MAPEVAAITDVSLISHAHREVERAALARFAFGQDSAAVSSHHQFARDKPMPRLLNICLSSSAV
ncbi:hypothetical protein ACFLVR_05200 [Chloroflexota bacterium]